MIRFPLAAIILIFSTQSSANAEEHSLFDLSLEELLQIKISGSTKIEQSLLTVPSSVTVYTQQELSRLGAANLNELINLVPGFQAKRHAVKHTSNQTATRGHISGTAGRDILVLLDGQRLGGDWAQGLDHVLGPFPLDLIEKIEFIKGAGSSLYGSSAFSAVINITSRKKMGQLALEKGTNQSSGHIQLNKDFEHFKLSGFVKVTNDTGFQYTELVDTTGNGKTESRDPYTQQDLYLKAEFEKSSVFFSHNRHKTEDFYAFRRLSNLNVRNDYQTHLKTDLELELFENTESLVSLSMLQNELDLHFELLPENTLGSEPVLIRTLISEKIPSIEWTNTAKFNNNASFIWGAEYRKPKISRAKVLFNYDIITPTFEYDANYFIFPLGKETSRNIGGIYAQYQDMISEKINLTVGARFDHYSDFGNSFNPRVATVYHLTDKTTVKLLYSRAFRAPSRNEQDLINNGVLLGNSELEPENIQQYELILVNQSDLGSISFSYFENHIDDLIVDLPRLDEALVRQNIDGSKFKGIELDYVGSVVENFQIRASYSNLLNTPELAFRASKVSATLSLNYNLAAYNFNIGGYYHSDSKNEDQSGLSDLNSYHIINAKFIAKINVAWELYVRVTNLTDKEFFTPTSAAAPSLDMPNRGREFYVGLEYRL